MVTVCGTRVFAAIGSPVVSVNSGATEEVTS